MKVRMGRVALVAEITPLPKNGRDRETSARFSKQSDGWLTSIRYGQMPIPVGEGGQADILIGARNIWRRSDAVAAAICQGGWTPRSRRSNQESWRVEGGNGSPPMAKAA